MYCIKYGVILLMETILHHFTSAWRVVAATPVPPCDPPELTLAARGWQQDPPRQWKQSCTTRLSPALPRLQH